MSLKEDSLEYHRAGSKNRAGKIGTEILTTCKGKEDLTLAYSPGVADPCLEISDDPRKIYEYTNKGNSVAVVSNGSAVLGLGNIGAAAGKPVMEGKALLFKEPCGVLTIACDMRIALEPFNLIGAWYGPRGSWASGCPRRCPGPPPGGMASSRPGPGQQPELSPGALSPSRCRGRSL